MSDATEALTPVQIATTVRETILELSSRPGVKPDVAAGLKSAAVGALACIEALKAQERALASPPNGAERDADFVRVPKVPTRSMLDAGYKQYCTVDRRGYSAWQDHLAVYEAMVDAALTP